MAERRGRKRRTDDRSPAPAYLSIAKLVSACQELGFVVSPGLGHAALKKLYLDNKRARLAPVCATSGDVRPTTGVHTRHSTRSGSLTSSQTLSQTRDTTVDTVESATEDISVVLPVTPARNLIPLDSGIEHTPSQAPRGDGERCAPLDRIGPSAHVHDVSVSTSGSVEAMMLSTLQLCKQSMETIQALTTKQSVCSDTREFSIQSAYAAHTATSSSDLAVNSLSPPPASQLQSAHAGQYNPVTRPHVGVKATSVSITDMVHPDIQKQIWTGKDVNLNMLLIPNCDPKKGSKDDPRLSRALSLDEFIVAFGRYKRTMVAEFPRRSQELDDYQAHIIETANIWPDSFYEYHKSFSAKCATILYQRNQLVNWAFGDTDLRQLVCAASKVRSCDICRSTGHTTSMCTPGVGAQEPRRKFQQFSPAKNFTRTTDVVGRDIAYHNGQPLCNNFNGFKGCTRTGCINLHVCKICKSSTHGRATCNKLTDAVQQGTRDTPKPIKRDQARSASEASNPT
jgi:hypothetical protein